ncbi:uncharacterized protein LOC8259934 [Ricinus communis]|uniref:Fiber protein Fb34 n=1 Tax=Ricinus communis TaxID=3988 RepID=B9RHS4_RICCO|nr:uncharacterized protein LOC8259934 [Ricinus communis]EEF48696.1 conserved hypothetical protein [Ricinus communis]|eukprot:XP_002513293.1 uncharacterized protein LOC8259934 [Ricinus communis]
MGFSIRHMAITVVALGITAFTFGILAEQNKPDSGKSLNSNGVITCKYPSDPSPIYGFLSIAFLTASSVIGSYSIFHPYKGRSVPLKDLFCSTTMLVFFQIAVWVSFLAEGMLVWTTVAELVHLTNNVHRDANTKCPTAKTGLFGGAAFMALNASLFWLVCLMLADNARDDYFNEDEENHEGHYGQVLTADYDVKEQAKV